MCRGWCFPTCDGGLQELTADCCHCLVQHLKSRLSYHFGRHTQRLYVPQRFFFHLFFKVSVCFMSFFVILSRIRCWVFPICINWIWLAGSEDSGRWKGGDAEGVCVHVSKKEREREREEGLYCFQTNKTGLVLKVQLMKCLIKQKGFYTVITLKLILVILWL